jgi:phosphatidylserine decarboxylase
MKSSLGIKIRRILRELRGYQPMNYKKSPIVLEGLVFFVPLAALSAVSYAFHISWLGGFFSAAALFVLWFFRNPERKIPEDVKSVLSPADGRVLKIEEVDRNDMLNGRYKKISIFMSVFNVHVNRMPCSGRVKDIRYRKGKFFSANLDKASELNESNAVLVETDDKKEILTIQIAGLIARRIVCWIEKGMEAIQGERFGLIRFGSRLEVFLPLEAEVLVKRGERVKAGETRIGCFK